MKKPGSTWTRTFFLNVAPDSPPTAALVRNGTTDGAVTATVAEVGSGSRRYKVTATIPGGYAPGDDIEYLATAIVDGDASRAIVAADVIGLDPLTAADVLSESEAEGLFASTPVTLPAGLPSAIVSAINTTGVRLRADGLDLIDVESTTNIPQAISVMLAALSGPVSIDDNGDDTYTLTFKAPGTNTTRISMVTTAAGERLTTTVSPPA